MEQKQRNSDKQGLKNSFFKIVRIFSWWCKMKSKELLKKKLINLASGELAAVLVFWMNFFLLKKWILTTKAFISVSFSLFLLTFILIQGSVFWWILVKRISNPGFAAKYTGKIYKILKELDFILLATGIFVILLNHGEVSTFIISFSDLDVCSYRVDKLLSTAIVLQLESCCFMQIHQIQEIEKE